MKERQTLHGEMKKIKMKGSQMGNPRGQEVHLCIFVLRARRERSADSFIIPSNTDVQEAEPRSPGCPGDCPPKPPRNQTTRDDKDKESRLQPLLHHTVCVQRVVIQRI